MKPNNTFNFNCRNKAKTEAILNYLFSQGFTNETTNPSFDAWKLADYYFNNDWQLIGVCCKTRAIYGGNYSGDNVLTMEQIFELDLSGFKPIEVKFNNIFIATIVDNEGNVQIGSYVYHGPAIIHLAKEIQKVISRK